MATTVVRADQSRCTGHARCNAFAPTIFTLDDNGYTDLTEVEIAPEDEVLARRGVVACPERALSIENREG